VHYRVLTIKSAVQVVDYRYDIGVTTGCLKGEQREMVFPISPKIKEIKNFVYVVKNFVHVHFSLRKIYKT
jgi:hypothetical protein